MYLKKYIAEYRDVISYLFFGVCTTIVNVVSYWGCAHLLKLDVLISSIVAWFFAVLFAYITNRKWVFNSQAYTLKAIIIEICSFFVCRIATGVVDWGCMLIFVDVLKFDDIIMKFLSNVLVIILNYIASKLVIFKRK